MAASDHNMQILIQKLTHDFPEIPEAVVYSCVRRYPNDYQRCVQWLKEESAAYLYGPVRDLYLRNKQEFVSNHHVESNQYQHNNYRFQRQFAHSDSLTARQNGGSPTASPNFRFSNQNANANYSINYSSSRGIPGSRSTSVSGPPASMGYQPTGNAQTHPKSAPVVSNQYHPFHTLDYQGPSASSAIPMSMPPGGQLAYSPDSLYRLQRQTGGYNYEMRVSCSHQAQVLSQRKQMERLHKKLISDKQKLNALRMDVANMEQALRNRRTAHNILPLEDLREQTNRLRQECDMLSKEFDSLDKDKKVPLGETDLSFYNHINPGQSGPIGVPPGRPPPIRSTPGPAPLPVILPSDEDSHQWSCSTCTFLNNPALDKCEICEMPRIMLGGPMHDVQLYFTQNVSSPTSGYS